MKKILYIPVFLVTVFFLISCDVDKLMDKEEIDPNSKEEVFKDKTKIRESLTHLYGSMWFCNTQGGFSLFSAQCGLLDNATDNSIFPGQGDNAKVFTLSTLTASGKPFANGTEPWTHYYRAIRSANVFMANIVGSVVTEEEQVVMKEEARLMRALYYHEMFRFYGALVIIGDEIVDGMTSSLVRASMEQTVNYIVSEFDAIIENGILPGFRWAANNDYGRMTLGMAYAYKARTLLYAASPLSTPDQSSQQAAAKWAAAAKAAKDLIDLGWYTLHEDATKPELSFARYFNERVSDEQILSILRAPTQDLYRALPSGAPWNHATAYPGIAITLNAIDAFAMKDGTKAILGYNPNGSPIINPASGYSDARPFDNRDPRMDMTVLRHGAKWKINGETITYDVNLHTANIQQGVTNILMRKFLDDRIDHWNSSSRTDMNLPMMRYAEVLLNYAEAKNESSASLTQSEIDYIVDCINLVRNRAAADPLAKAGWTQETLRDQIKMERRMEFMLEGHRFYDVRRWKEADKYFNADVYGMDIVGGNMVRRKVESRIFLDKLYRLPVPSREVAGSKGNIWQNPGW